MHTPERRKFTRYTVKFRTSFSVGKMLAGEGVVTDLSLRGCRLVCTAVVPAETHLEMQVYLEDQAQPVKVESATVRWSKGRECGIEFLVIEPQSFDQLKGLIASLETAASSQKAKVRQPRARV